MLDLRQLRHGTMTHSAQFKTFVIHFRKWQGYTAGKSVCVFVCNLNIISQKAGDVVAMGTNAAVIQNVSSRDVDRLYY